MTSMVLLRMLAVSLCGMSLIAQTSVVLGELYGKVTSSNGAVLADVAVTLANEDTGFRRQTPTDALGEYRFLLIPSGTYTLRVVKTSFGPAERREVRVLVGQATSLDMVLEEDIAIRTEISVPPGKLTAAPAVYLVDVERTHPANFIGETRIRDLPMNRRDYLSFVLLAPGVADARVIADNTDLRVKQTPTSDISFFGSNGRGNSVTVDGGEMFDGGGGVRSNVSQEAVQEFQVNRGNYSAEIGAASGGAINIVTKSGTNGVHGSAFWFTRHQSLDASDPFARLVGRGGVSRIKPPSKRQQLGGSIGGPLRRDRTFIFAAFESLVRRESSVVSILSDYSIFGPTPAQEGLLRVLPPAQSGALRALLTSPLSTVQLFEQNSGVHPFSTDSFKSSVRLDHLRSERDQLFLRLDVPHANESNANVQALIGASRGLETKQFDPTAVAGWTHIFSPRLANEVRLQANYRKFQMKTREPFGPELRIAGYGVFNRDIFLPSRNIERRFEFKDNLHIVRGRHVIRTGGQLWLRGILADSEVFFPGRFTFGDLPGAVLDPALPADFVITGLQAFNLGLPQTFIMGSGSSALGAFYPYGGVYLQDSWRATRRLTLDLGLRYEIDARKSPLRTDRNNVAPRFGFAWNIDGQGQTVVRGGYGLFYGLGNFGIDYTVTALNEIGGYRQIAQAFTSILAPGAANAANIFGTLRQSGAISIPTPTRGLTPADLAQFGLTFSQRGPRPPFTVLFEPSKDFASPYTQQASLSVERQIGRDVTLEVGGVWSRTLRLPRTRDANLLPAPVDRTLGIRVWSDPSSFVDPLLASRNVFESTARASYAAGTVELRKRVSAKLDLGANYTLSRAIDDTLDYNYEFAAFDQTNLRAERGLSSFHQKHKFVLWGISNLPGRVLASWIVRANSGRPFNLLAGYDLNQDRNDQTDRPAFAGRNTGLSAAYFTADLRVARTFRLTERSRLDFTAEAFNLLNHLNFASINNVVGNIAGPFNLRGRPDRLPSQPLGFTSAYETRKIQLGFRVSF